MQPSIMPNELLNLILDNIDIDSPAGRQSLVACSHASHALQSMSRWRIFQDVAIPYNSSYDTESNLVLVEEEKATSTKFLDLITSSPPIASYVRSLTIDIVPRSTSAGSPWISSSAPVFSLYTIVSRLYNLKKFIAAPCEITWKWPRIEKHTRDFFLNVVSLVQELDLRLFYKFPISAFFGRCSLEELHVSSFVWDQPEDTTFSVTSKVKLRVLDIGHGAGSTTSLVSWFISPLSPLDISHLRDLKLSYLYYTNSDIDGMLALCASTLEKLFLRVDVNSMQSEPGRPTFRKLSFLYKLRQLTFQMSVRGHADEQSLIGSVDHYANRLSYIASSLKTLPSNTRHHPVLQLNVIIRAINVSDLDANLRRLPWTELTNVLNDQWMLGYLKKVKIIVEVIERRQGIEQTEISKITLSDILDRNAGLKSLRERSILSYDCIGCRL